MPNELQFSPEKTILNTDIFPTNVLTFFYLQGDLQFVVSLI